jgi:hypothetical protein
MLATLRASLEHGQLPGVNGCDTVRNGPRWTHSRPILILRTEPEGPAVVL